MSNEIGNPDGDNPPTASKSPWAGGVGFVLKLEGLKKGEEISMDLSNTTPGNQDSTAIALGPFLPHGEGPYTSSLGPVNFQLWGSSTGDLSTKDISVPVYKMLFNPTSLTITLASNFTTTNSAVYCISFYAWYKSNVTDITMKRRGGATTTSCLAWWVDNQGDASSAVNFNGEKTGSVEYPISS